jgi:hypothetical protein
VLLTVWRFINGWTCMICIFRGRIQSSMCMKHLQVVLCVIGREKPLLCRC